jgi:hypothetical protein
MRGIATALGSSIASAAYETPMRGRMIAQGNDHHIQRYSMH